MSEVLSREYPIGTLAMIPPGEGRAFEVDGVMVAVFRSRAGEVYACQNACPHRGGPLADGILGGHVVMCPLHERSFDLLSGRELGGDHAVSVYKVRHTADDRLWLTLPAG